jgi:hypothetical protein
VFLDDSTWTTSLKFYRRYVCAKCWTARQKKYAEKNPKPPGYVSDLAKKKRAAWTPERKKRDRDRAYNNSLQKQYGITVVDFDRMFDNQQGKCAICETEKPRGRGGFHVDHCHTSGKVRALLCAGCNMMLGLAKDTPEVMKAAMQYLIKHKGEEDI